MTGLILLVEDEEILNRNLVRILRKQGFQVLSYGNSIEAMVAMRDEGVSYDLAVIDRRLHGVGGDDLLDLSKRLHPDVPVISMSGYNQKPYGADEFVVKSRTLHEDLIAMANKYLKK